jgi:hypothetical protein
VLKIEVDLFSGRPNPEWIITDTETSDSLLDAVAHNPEVAAVPGTGYQGLGFREVLVSYLADDPGRKARPRVPRQFALGSTASRNFEASTELALTVVNTIGRSREVQLVSHTLTPLTADLWDLIVDRIRIASRVKRDPSVFPVAPHNPRISTVADPRCETCRYEVSEFNPAFWNAPTVQPLNNCYNYARNWRTDTFAQPGRAHGAGTGTKSCPAVTTAAMADGLVRRCTCLPESEFPRRLMALVIDPGVDYHWYRHQRGGFWGHKPGKTAARNVDNAGAVITDPEMCDRGGYTDFCGYFYAGRSVVIN